MKIIALEGPSYAGKSTAVARLRADGIEQRAFVADCYVQHIAHRDDIPPARTGSAAEQLAAFEKFMGIEHMRVRAARASGKSVAVIDRSVDTLLAHAHALDSMFGYDVHERLRTRLEVLPFLRPDHTLYLDVPAEDLRLRREVAGHMAAESEYFLHEPAFLASARDYFVQGAHLPLSREVTVIPADTGSDAVARAVEAFVDQWMR